MEYDKEEVESTVLEAEGVVYMYKQPTRKKSAHRTFFIAFCGTLCVVWLVFGMLKVDYHGRQMSINDSTPVLAVTKQENGKALMEFHAFGQEKSYEVTKFIGYWEKFKEFCCLPN